MSTTPPDPQANRLTAEETSAIAEMLQAGVPTQSQEIVGPTASGVADPIVLRYDLVAGTRRRTDDLPGLQLIHERFTRELAAEFRRTIGQEGVLTAERIQHTKFAEIYAALPSPTALALVDFRGVGCSMIINMEPELMLHFLDILMGGQGGQVDMPGNLAIRGFTATEYGLITHLMGIISRAMTVAWSDVTRVSLELGRVATDPRHAAVYAPGDRMVDMRVGVEWGELKGRIQVIVPVNHLGQFEDELSRTATPDHLNADERDIELMAQNLGPITVEVRTELGRAELTLADLVEWQVGDVIRLDADPEQPLVTLVAGVPKIQGFPTVLHGNNAIRVSELLYGDFAHEGGDSS